MNIIQKNEEKINGVLETFDRIIINDYLLNHFSCHIMFISC